MTLRLTLLATVAFTLLMQSSAQGHHFFAAEFTAEETATITGVVTEIWFLNPNTEIHPYECDPDSFYRQMYEQEKLDMYFERTQRRQFD